MYSVPVNRPYGLDLTPIGFSLSTFTWLTVDGASNAMYSTIVNRPSEVISAIANSIALRSTAFSIGARQLGVTTQFASDIWAYVKMATFLFFTARRSYASAVLGVVILSVRPSVCPSVCTSVCHTRAL